MNFGFRFCMVSVKKKLSRFKKKRTREHSVEITKKEEKKRQCSWLQCALTIDQCAVLLQGKMSVTSDITHV